MKQFDDLLVKIIIAAAIVSFIPALINGETGLMAFMEPSVILMILAANAAVGVITETNAEKALEELRAYQADVATILRNGCFSILPATELVLGDIVEVSGKLIAQCLKTNWVLLTSKRAAEKICMYTEEREFF